MVDLGLPSGLKWAKCNIGAETEEGYGLYFQWGATVGYKGDEALAHSTWSTAPFNNGSSYYDEAYFNAHKSEWLDGDILKPQYDAATVNMGSQYSLPTKEDFQELINNTTNEWIKNYKDSGVNGRLFTSKTNSNTLFIPASGRANGGSIMSDVGSYLYVWSSTLYTSSPYCARHLYGSSSSCYMNFNYYRCLGFSVRGVCK